MKTISLATGGCGCFGGRSSKVVWISPQLSPVYAGKTCGLCGNYNGNRGDDFVTPAGLAEPLVEDFGNAWKLHGDCENLQKQPSDPCSLNPRLSMQARGGDAGGTSQSPEVPRLPVPSMARCTHFGGTGAQGHFPSAFDYLHLDRLFFQVP